MLVLFDVDGTLTATNAVDGEVYANCFVAVFGTAMPTTNWAEYACPTDQGIADEAVRRLQLDLRLIRFRGHRVKGGYGVRHGRREEAEATA